jgi:hypothetical protein
MRLAEPLKDHRFEDLSHTRRPTADVMREWIENFRSLKWFPWDGMIDTRNNVASNWKSEQEVRSLGPTYDFRGGIEDAHLRIIHEHMLRNAGWPDNVRTQEIIDAEKDLEQKHRAFVQNVAMTVPDWRVVNYQCIILHAREADRILKEAQMAKAVENHVQNT